MRGLTVRGLSVGIVLAATPWGTAEAQQPGSYPGQSPPPPGIELEAGGLRPPGELPEDEAAPSAVEQDLAASDAKDTGRGLQFVWLNADVGYQYVDLTALSDGDLLPPVPGATEGIPSDRSGLLFGGGLGVRLLYFTFGARFRYGALDDWNLWSLLGEAGFRVPFGNFEPYVNLGAGYVTLANFDAATKQAAVGSGTLAVHGLDVRLALGFDYHLSSTFSVGPQFATDLLVLSRNGVATAPVPAYAADGSSVGLALQGALVLGLHF
jgi:hypothetical protein